MKTNTFVVLVVLLLPLAAFINQPAARQPEAKAALSIKYVQLWEHAKTYTLEVAQSMPDDQYSYKPSPEEMTFAEQMNHIADATMGMGMGLLKGEKMPESPAAKPATKKEVVDNLTKSYDFMISTVKNMPDADFAKKVNVEFLKMDLTKEEIMLFIRDHGTHHRGQSVVYLREKGIKPPQYRGF